MGQYYNAVLISKNEVLICDRRLKGQGYCMAKLTEHSWFGNHFCDTVGFYLFKKPRHVVWVGDYAEQKELDRIPCLYEKNIKFEIIWDEAVGYDELEKHDFNWEGKFIINCDKHEFITVNKYWNGSVIKIGQDDCWVLNPIPILCSVGNGEGSGDYKGLCMDDVGRWAGDLILVDDLRPIFFKELTIAFKEECYCK